MHRVNIHRNGELVGFISSPTFASAWYAALEALLKLGQNDDPEIRASGSLVIPLNGYSKEGFKFGSYTCTPAEESREAFSTLFQKR